MNQRHLFVAVVAAALTVGLAGPASAEPTPAELTVTAGFLTITVPSASANLGSKVNTVLAGVVSGSLGQVQVNDARSAIAGSGWVASVISTAFTPAAGPAIAASAVGYAAGTVTQVGTATFTPNDRSDLTAVGAAITATGITGDNSATWNPTINVTVPGGAAAGVYTATITHSLV